MSLWRFTLFRRNVVSRWSIKLSPLRNILEISPKLRQLLPNLRPDPSEAEIFLPVWQYITKNDLVGDKDHKIIKCDQVPFHSLWKDRGTNLAAQGLEGLFQADSQSTNWEACVGRAVFGSAEHFLSRVRHSLWIVWCAMNLIVFLELNSSRSGGASLSQTLPEALRREGSGGLKVDLPVDVVDTAFADLQDSETQAVQKSTKVLDCIRHIVSSFLLRCSWGTSCRT